MLPPILTQDKHCADACSGLGTQSWCPPLIVLATAAERLGAKAGALRCLAGAMLKGMGQRRPVTK
jgi:hypothetical protein